MLQSNDYLAISGHEEIIEAQSISLAESGMGMMMSAQFVHDHSDPLHLVEADLAQALGSEAGILTQSGFAANVDLIQAIAGRTYPSTLMSSPMRPCGRGIKSAGACAVPFLHNVVDHLERQVLRNGPGVIVIDAVYSTNGSLAPLAAIADIAQATGCVFVVDESHSLGTHGEHGEGLVTSLGLNDRVHFITASLTKAYCSRAGLITCTTRFKEYFGYDALPAIFSSSLLPHDITGLAAAYRVIQSEEWRRTRLRTITTHVRGELNKAGFPVDEGTEQIIALEAGPELSTIRVRDMLEDNGVIGSIFFAPATALNRSLLRLTLNAGMSDADTEQLVSVCKRIRHNLDIPSWSATRRASRSEQVQKEHH